MKAGLELDALVAEKVTGWVCASETWEKTVSSHEGKSRSGWVRRCPNHGKAECIEHMPSYSTDIAATWCLAERFRVAVIPLSNGRWWASLEGSSAHDPQYTWYERACEPDDPGIAETAPLAICRILLHAVTTGEISIGGKSPC